MFFKQGQGKKPLNQGLCMTYTLLASGALYWVEEEILGDRGDAELRLAVFAYRGLKRFDPADQPTPYHDVLLPG